VHNVHPCTPRASLYILCTPCLPCNFYIPCTSLHLVPTPLCTLCTSSTPWYPRVPCTPCIPKNLVHSRTPHVCGRRCSVKPVRLSLVLLHLWGLVLTPVSCRCPCIRFYEMVPGPVSGDLQDVVGAHMPHVYSKMRGMSSWTSRGAPLRPSKTGRPIPRDGPPPSGRLLL